MDYQTNFNPATPSIMHIDLNSCFASVEQQANPLLRDKPVAVVHSTAPYGCILAPSVEAKLWGVKTGMSLREGQDLCPILIVRQVDPPKYRAIHSRFAALLSDYSDGVISKSIDEFCLPLRSGYGEKGLNLQKIAQDIKSRIKSEIGDYLRVSIGISTNQNLAKLASGLHKPDGLDIIDANNVMAVYSRIKLQDFCGINVRNEARLNRFGIFTPLQFATASRQTLRAAFQSVLGDYWYTRLRGYEVDLPAVPHTALQAGDTLQKSFAQSYILPRPMDKTEWYPIMAKLVSKAARRMRSKGYRASGVHVSLRYHDHSHFRFGHTTQATMSSDQDLIKACDALTAKAKGDKVKKIAVTLFGISREDNQESLFIDKIKANSLVTALDNLNSRYGDYSIFYASLMGSSGHVRDAIAFGKV